MAIAGITWNEIVYIINHYIHALPLKYPYRLVWAIPILIIIWIIIEKTFVKFPQPEEKKHFRRATRWIRAFVLLTRTIMVLLLVVAFASPTMITQKEIQGEPRLTILTDASNSFSLFDTTIASKLKKQLEQQLPTKMIEIATGDYSALADGILSHMQGDDSILIVSDGNNNKGRDLGDVLLFASQVNATINALNLEPIKQDTAVRLEGPAMSIVGGDITINMITEQAGRSVPYRLTIEIDGNNVLDKAVSGPHETSITQQLGEGHHKVIARIEVDGPDYFAQNNVFYKAVQVVPKPKVLFVSQRASPLEEKLNQWYDIQSASTLSEQERSFKDFTAIFLNDINNAQLEQGGKETVDAITDYLVDGGGLMLLGGEQSFDLGGYKDSYFETILPVISGECEKEEEKEINLVVVIDISGSTGAPGASGQKAVDIEKALAVKIIQDLREEDRVGIVAFNSFAFQISPLTPLASKKEEMISLVSSLVDGGGTDVEQGIRMAEQMLINQKGSRNIILISDGRTINDEGAFARVQGARMGGIKLYSVGVGGKTDEAFMKRIAQNGEGIYFKPDESQHLKILFGDPEEDDKKSKDLVVIDANHFITKDLAVGGTLGGYNQIVPKGSANMLVTLSNGAPIGAVWRFGLGKVGVIATDDGAKWGGALLTEQNSPLITRMLNWVIGDPTKNEPFGVFTSDTTAGETTEVKVKSTSIPTSKDIELNKIDQNLYKGMFTASKTGFFDLLGSLIAVNYPTEYMKIGMNPQLESLVMITGGTMFDPNEIDAMIEQIKSHAVRTERKEVSFSWPFVMAAIALFLLEIIIRRVKENG